MAEKKKSIWSRLFPGFTQADASGLPIAGGIYEGFIGDATNLGGVSDTLGEGEQQLYELPKERIPKYAIYDAMSSDPTIDSALKMHIAHALSARSDTGEILTIESTGDGDNPVVKDLRDNLLHIINRDCQQWAYSAALYGITFARVYGKEGVGITHLRHDYYTHPRHIRAYEKAGQLAGYASAHQQAANGGKIELMEPWDFVQFRIPIWKIPTIEPMRVDQQPFDLSKDDIESETLTDSQNYGQSMIETAFVPWMDLQEAIISMNMSRKNAARLERMIGVNTGKLNPQKAAQYLNVVSGAIQKADKKNSEQSLRKGFVQTVINHMIPIFGDGRGRLDVSTVEGSPNIDGLADVDFHIKRLGSALGIDPSLLGFGEMLSGGLGDGGFFRISVLAAVKANMLRKAILDGVERLCEIHVALKYKKVFLPNEKPWRVIFNSVSTSLEREERESAEGRVMYATSLAQLVGMIDQEFSTCDKNAFENFMFTDILKVEEEKFNKMFPKKKAEEAEALAKKNAEAEAAAMAGGVTESGFDAAAYIDRIYEEAAKNG